MKQFFLIWFLTYFILPFAMGGDEVGNGAGIAENNVLYAYRNIGTYITNCLASESCGLDIAEETVLNEINNSLPQEYLNSSQLVFLSGRKFPQIFIYPFQNERFAVTGDNIGSTIYVNLDLLYMRINNQTVPTSLPQAISILTHEFGHHHGIDDENLLYSLGAKVAKNLAHNIINVPLGTKFPNIIAKVIKTNDPEGDLSFDGLILYDGIKYFDVTKNIKKGLVCPSLEIEQLDLVGISIWQPHWKKYQGPAPFLTADLILYCKSTYSQKIHVFSGDKFNLRPIYFKNPQNTVLIKDIQFRHVTCLSDPAGCLVRKNRLRTFWPNIGGYNENSETN